MGAHTFRQGVVGGLLLSLGALVGGTTSGYQGYQGYQGGGARDTPLQRGVQIVVPGSWWGEAALSLAVGDLTAHLGDTYGVRARVVKDQDVSELSPYAFVLGDRNQAWVKTLRQAGVVEVPSLPEEGYYIQDLRFRGSYVIIVSGDLMGTVYGTFKLIERSRIDPKILFRPLRLNMAPKMTFRLVSDPTGPAYPTPEQALRWGFNAVAVEPWPSLLLYDALDPAIYDPKLYAKERAWVEEKRRLARQQIAIAKAYHLKVVTPGDVISLPRQVLALYKTEVADGVGRFCIAKKKTNQLLRYAMDELFRDFPEIDAVMVRTGENYPRGPMTGNDPALARCNLDNAASGTDGVRQTLELFQAKVIDGHGRILIQRGWDLGAGGMHASPQVAAQATEGIETSEGKLVLSFKNTQTDFWRFNGFNPNLGQGRFPQMIEFQAQREYEGKGAFPNYLGPVYAWGAPETSRSGGMLEAYKKGVRWVWVWAKGGGWDGPFPQADLWIEANIYALSHLAWTPTVDPQRLALDWAIQQFGAQVASDVARILVSSSEAVVNAFYISPYARIKGPWAPQNLWVRDDMIYGGDRLADIYRTLTEGPDYQDFHIAIDEKAEAVDQVDDMLTEWERLMPAMKNQPLAKTALTSLYYQKALFEVLRDYFSGILFFYRWADSGRQNDADWREAVNYLKSWEEAWARYNDQIVTLPQAATPFLDGGMVGTVRAAQADLRLNHQ